MSGPIPARVDETVKTVLLDIIDEAVAGGWKLNRVCGVIELDRQRAWRWMRRRDSGTLTDRAPGGNPIHGLLDWEEAEILAVFDDWGDRDMSHRKLAHRGSYEHRVWVSPSTVDRVLTRNGLVLAGNPRPAASEKKPWPDWCEWRPNQLWCWDMSQFERCERSKYVYGIVDLVSRKWVTTIVTPEPTSTSVQVLFTNALQGEGLMSAEIAARLADPDNAAPDDDDTVPLLLAISDNGTEMKASDTRKFMALCSMAQHFGRRATPTDQAWIETLWGHVKHENPHLMAITDPAVLAAELERVRRYYNTVRLHEGIGYVTPDDEHNGRGDTIRAARQTGLTAADQQRRQWHRNRQNQP